VLRLQNITIGTDKHKNNAAYLDVGNENEIEACLARRACDNIPINCYSHLNIQYFVSWAGRSVAIRLNFETVES
jgi:hypothetical protein